MQRATSRTSSKATEAVQPYWRACSTWRAYVKDRFAHPWLAHYWPECIAVDSMSREALERLQQERWEKLRKHVLTHVPYYRQWARREGISPDDDVPVTRFPIVSKDAYLENPDAFLSDAYETSSLRTHTTSGSSGQPLRVVNDVETRDYSYACMWRALTRHGVRPGDRMVHVWGSGKPRFASSARNLAYAIAVRFQNWFSGRKVIPAGDLSIAQLEKSVASIERHRPHFIHGYVSALHSLAQYLHEHNRTLRTPELKLVVTDAEPLNEAQREAMQKAFQCTVVQHYGCLELGNIAQEDVQGNLRVNEDYLLLERLANGQAVFTHLLAKAMPFIRYQVGDYVNVDTAQQGDLPYRCLSSIDGRVTDLLPLPHGGHVHGLAIAKAVYGKNSRIRRYQIRQRRVDYLEIAIFADGPLGEQSRNDITSSVRRVVGHEAEVIIREVAENEMPLNASGKFQLVISDVVEQENQSEANTSA